MKTLSESALYEGAFLHAPVAMAMLSPEGRFLKVNRAVCTMLGFTEEELLNKTSAELTLPEERERTSAAQKRVLSGEVESERLEKHYIRKDGSTVWGLLTLAAGRNAQGERSYIIGQWIDITESNRVKEELTWKTAFFEAKVNSSLDGILVLDDNLNIILENRRMYEVWGFPPEIQKADTQTRIPWVAETTKEPQKFLDIIDRLAANPREVSKETIELKDGRSIEQYSSPVESDDGTCYGRIWSFRDITDSMRTRERLDRFFAMSPDIIFIAGFDGYFKKTNPSATRILGYTEQEFLAVPFLSFGLNEDAEPNEQAIRGLLEIGRMVDFEVRLRCKDGSFRWLEMNAVTVPNEQLIYANARDITERKQAEAELERVRQEHDKVLCAVGDGVHWLGLDGVIRFENPAGAKMLGYEVDELIGKRAHFVMHHLHPDGSPYPVEECPIYATLHDGQTRHVKDEVFQRKDGTSFAVEYRCTPTHDEKGDANGCVVTFIDVTEQKRAQAEMQNARIVAENASRAKSEFLANMSHEIRTPLNGIIGMTDLIGGTQLTAEQKDFVETIHASGENLLAIVNDVLDFSKIEFGKLELDHHAFSLLDLADDIIGMLNYRMTKKHLEFVTTMHDDLPAEYLGDATRIRQVLVNLVNNAVKFTEQGSVRLEVSPGVPQPEDPPGTHRVLFSVRDTGIGIPADRMDRLFKIFSQVDTSTTRRFGGSGLGLAICQKLVELMGGTIKVESRVNEGSVFSFELPLLLAHEQISIGDEGSDLQGRRVLIVDDIETNRRMLTLQLARWGISWVDVSAGQKALDLLASGEKFDLALLDFQMPQTDGIMLARQIRSFPNYATLPLVLISSQTGDVTMDELREAGFSAVLAKPIRQNLLRSTLQQVFRSTGLLPMPLVEESKPTPLPLSILVVEDNTTNQKVARQILRRLGYDTDIVSNGQEAVDAVAAKAYDLIFMDIHMPEVDGVEATRQIRSEAHPLTRPWIVALTADVLKGEKELCLTAGMDDYLTKPVKIEGIKKVIDELQEKRLRQFPATIAA